MKSCGLGIALTAYPRQQRDRFWQLLAKLSKKPPLVVALPAAWAPTIGPNHNLTPPFHRFPRLTAA